MNYLINNAFIRIKQNWKLYTLFCVQIIIAIVMLSISASISLTVHEKATVIENDPMTRILYFVSVNDNKAIYNKYDFVQYSKIKDEYGDSLDVCIAKKGLIGLIDENMKVYDYRCFQATDQILRFGYDINAKLLSKPNIIYANEDFVPLLEYNLSNEKFKAFYEVNGLLIDSVSTDDSTITLTNGKTYFVKPISDLRIDNKTSFLFYPVSNVSVIDEYTYNLNDCIFVPYDAEILGADSVSGSYLAINKKENATSSANIPEILNYLQESTNGIYSFMVTSVYQSYTEVNHGYIMMSNIINFIMTACVIIVGIGFTGFMLIMIEKRKKNIAVSCVCGAKHKTIIVELLMEIFIVIMMSFALGSFISVTVQMNMPSLDGLPYQINYLFFL